jgi:hypothetical protein
MTFYAAFVLALALMGWLCVRSTSGTSRLVVTGLFVAFCFAAPIAYFDTLARPKAVTDEIMRRDKEVEVLAYHAIPGESLFLVLQLPGLNEPRFYGMPWNENTEKMVQELQDGAEAGQRMKLVNPFESSLESERRAYPMPPEKSPDKQVPALPDSYRAD